MDKWLLVVLINGTCCSLFFAEVIFQGKKCGKCFFSFFQRFHADLLAGLRSLCDMSRASHASVPIAAVEEMLGYVVYGGHAINGLDLNAVKSIASSIFVDSVGKVSVSSFLSFPFLSMSVLLFLLCFAFLLILPSATFFLAIFLGFNARRHQARAD